MKANLPLLLIALMLNACSHVQENPLQEYLALARLLNPMLKQTGASGR